MKNRPIFILAPMSRIGVLFGRKMVQACGRPIAAVDDERSSETLHGISRWSSAQFRAQAGNYPDAIAIDCSSSLQGRTWVEHLCGETGVECISFMDAQVQLGLAIDTSRYEVFLENSPLSLHKHALHVLDENVREIMRMLRYTGIEGLRGFSNPMARHGAKVYSQNDEDGITFEILRRLGIKEGVFVEYGVGDGTENNTLSLLANRWKGVWVGNQDLAFSVTRRPESGFCYSQRWVTKSNVRDIFYDGLNAIGQSTCNLISMDLDGNDWYFVQELLCSGMQPDVFIVEYNAKFVPPIKFVIDYDEQHEWQGDDYFGASFAAFVELFERFDYFPVCCNITGSNAFFVRSAHKHLFQDVPESMEDIFMGPKYFLTGLDCSGHPASLKTISRIVNQE